jgi:E3 ubiquitin-protein ligase SHPRH
VDKLQAIHDVPDKMPLSFFEGRDVEGQICYVSPVFNVVTRDLGPFQASEQAIRGGILAEEMGLGKTVEIIGLILLHTRPFEPPKVFDAYTGASVTPTSGTLIVAPNALRDQWVSEIRRHAPILRVKSYAGIGRERFLEQDEEAAFISELATYDVVVTTYSVLAAELNFALVPPDRGRRVPRKYHRAKSPLVQISWWRVCMDEAQMIESGVSKAGTVARIIPRINAWGVTGTPVRDKVDGK